MDFYNFIIIIFINQKELVNIDEKKSKTRERRSRSTSKTRSSSRKRSEIKGAKLYTKVTLVYVFFII